jgi:transposase
MYEAGVLPPLEMAPDKRRKLEESAEQYLRAELKAKQIAVVHKRQKKSPPPRRWHRKVTTMQERVQIVCMAYGDVGSLGPMLRRPREIALALGIRYNTVIVNLRKYRQAGGVITPFVHYHRGQRTEKITPELGVFLLAPATLKAWRGWPMARRVHEIRERWGVDMSRPTLAKFYRRHGIRRMTTPFHWHTNTAPEDRDEQRRQFVVQLVEYLRAGKEVVFIDETSVCVWDRRIRTWMYRDDPLPFELPQDRGHSVTVVGAISTKKPGLVYKLSDSTNKDAVERLVRKVLKRSEDTEEMVVVWDNHSAHRSKNVKELLADANAIRMPLPVNSSDLNPIERVWAQLKPKWQHALYTSEGGVDPIGARVMLRRVLDEEVVPKTGNYAMGGRDLLLRALLGPPRARG